MTRLTRAILVAVLAMLATSLATGCAGAAHAAQEPGPETSGSNDADVVLILFHGDGCPHCATAISFIVDDLAPVYPDLEVVGYEVWTNEANRAVMAQAAEVYGFEPGPVPVTIVDGPTGSEVFVGFGAQTGQQIEAVVARELAAAGGADPPTTTIPGTTTTAGTTTLVDIPIIGEVDLGGSSLLVATLVIGLVDGINPCSLWVLSVLLAIVLHSGSRGRVALVGTVFLAVTAGMYAIYVAGVYSVLSVLDGMVWIRVVVAAVALTFGVLQLRDGLRIDHAATLSISADRRPGLYQRMRGVASGERGVVATVAGTVVLAVGVSLLETPCTAGLPLLWANLLADQGVSTAGAVILFAVYMTVFLIDELLVFAVAVVTLRSMKMQQRHGQALKIVAGSVLVTLAAAMIVLPSAMQTVSGTVLVFGVAVVLGLVVWLVARWRAQARTQRVSSVESSASAMNAGAKPGEGSKAEPSVMRRP